MNNAIGIIGSITNFGLNTTGVREVSSAYSDNDKKKFSERLIVLQRWFFIVGLFGAILTILFSKFLRGGHLGKRKIIFGL